MFVQSNKVSDLKQYFYKKLEHQFSQNEIKLMFQFSLQKRLNLSASDLFLGRDVLLSESDLLFVRDIANRLLANEPFQYIVGETLFCDLTIKCDKRALIPRPETEELVFWVQESFRDKKQEYSFIDFCTGSGCIALSLKNSFPNTHILATDYSYEALVLAKENSELNKLDISFLEHDLLTDTFELMSANSIDCIVSNPPYIPEKDKSEMHENVLKFEPHLALFVSNENPLIFYQKIAEIAKKELKKDGFLFFEIHENLAKEVKAMLLNLDFSDVEIKKDLQGKDRMIRAKKKMN
ncbi:MAG: peptide chain release factor N(5)-glutamine methyltransferase [Bacteroidota bacterium]